MNIIHIFGKPLYQELFRHNIISRNGFVKANDEELSKYYTFLIQRAKERTSKLYKERSAMVDKVEILIKKRRLNKKQWSELKHLLKKLNLTVNEDGMLEPEIPVKQKTENFDISEPLESILEYELYAREKKRETLKHDLRNLNKWLNEISEASIIPAKKSLSKQTVEEKTSNGISSVTENISSIEEESTIPIENSQKHDLISKKESADNLKDTSDDNEDAQLIHEDGKGNLKDTSDDNEDAQLIYEDGKGPTV